MTPSLLTHTPPTVGVSSSGSRHGQECGFAQGESWPLTSASGKWSVSHLIGESLFGTEVATPDRRVDAGHATKTKHVTELVAGHWHPLTWRLSATMPAINLSTTPMSRSCNKNSGCCSEGELPCVAILHVCCHITEGKPRVLTPRGDGNGISLLGILPVSALWLILVRIFSCNKNHPLQFSTLQFG